MNDTPSFPDNPSREQVDKLAHDCFVGLIDFEAARLRCEAAVQRFLAEVPDSDTKQRLAVMLDFSRTTASMTSLYVSLADRIEAALRDKV